MFNRPTLETLIERTKQDFESRLETKGSVLRRALIAVEGRVMAGASHLMHGHLDFISEQIMPDTAIKTYLRRWASIWNVEPTEATYASGTVEMTGTNGTVIPEGSLLRRSDDIEYESQEDATISGGTADLTVEAFEAGENGNADSGVQLTLVSPISGVNSTGTVGEDGIAGGNNEESDESLLSRLLDRIQYPPMGGSEADYKKWAREVAGVTRVWVYPEWLGPGTVGVTFVRDDDEDIFPSAAEVEEVQDYIDEQRPVTAHVTVFAPIPDPIDYNITLTPSTEAVKAAVEAELEDMTFRDAEPAGTILLSRMNEAISIADGETDHVLNSPVVNHTSAAGHLPVMGTVTWV